MVVHLLNEGVEGGQSVIAAVIQRGGSESPTELTTFSPYQQNSFASFFFNAIFWYGRVYEIKLKYDYMNENRKIMIVRHYENSKLSKKPKYMVLG